MTYLHALILGIVEGITEFLPISSTGHLTLTAELLGVSQTNFTKTFAIAIQLGAILAVLLLYGRSLLTSRAVFQRVVVAFLPTAVLGLIFYKIIKTYLLGNTSVVAWALGLGGVVIIITELMHKEKSSAVSEIKDISYRQAFCIGLAQSVSMIPGVSRAAATILGGLFLGLKRVTATEFSFLLAIPTMAAASGLDLLKNAGDFTQNQMGVLGVGFICSFFVALLFIKLLMNFVKKHTFIPFGIYRVGLALVLLVFM